MPKTINNKKLQKKIGENIEQFRLLQKKTIKEIAPALKFSGTAYRNIERGITNPSIGKLFDIALVLEVDITRLFDVDINTIAINTNGKKDLSANKQLEESYSHRIQQYKDENTFLRKRIETLEGLITNRQDNELRVIRK